MGDSTLKLIWSRLQEGWGKMADLADRLDDLICSFDESGPEIDMDTITIMFLGWITFGVLVIIIANFLYQKYVKSRGDEPSKTPEMAKSVADIPQVSAPTPVSVAAETGVFVRKAAPPAGAAKPPTPTTPLRSPASVLRPPVATGPESESVQWVNSVFSWLYSSPIACKEILDVWVHALNGYATKLAIEHGVIVKFKRLLPDSQAPDFSNVFCECSPVDDITITCDHESTFSLTVEALRQKGEETETSEYRVNVDKLRGRLSIACVTSELFATVKFDGWPEVKLTVVQSSTADSGIDEQHLQDIIKEIITSALRNVVVHLSLSRYSDFPRFVRTKLVADPVIPIHYDSMLTSSVPPAVPASAALRRLLVKIIKANSIGGNEEAVSWAYAGTLCPSAEVKV